MKKPNKLQNLFLVGLIPIIIGAAFLGLILFGAFHTKKVSAETGRINKPLEDSVHVCPKPETVTIHDTVYVECKRRHYEPKKETETVSEPVSLRNDTNLTEKKSE